MALVDEAIRRYHDLLFDKLLDDTREHLARAIERDPLVAECRVLRPYFIDARVYTDALAATALLHEALATAIDRLLAEPALRHALGIPPYFDELLELDRAHGRLPLMARFDGLFDPGGVLQVIEYNSQPEFSPARAIDDMFATARIATELARSCRFQTMRLDELAVDALRDAQGRDTPVTIAIPGGDDRGRHWLRHARTRGHRTTFAPYERYRLDGARLVVDDHGTWPVDLIVVPWEDALAPGDEMDAVLAAIASGAVRAVDGISRGLLCGYKHALELLSDPVHAGMFDHHVSAALARHVPWTRVVRERTTSGPGGDAIDLVPYIAANREKLVLKPSGGTQGEGVVIGGSCDAGVWSQTLTLALKRPYVVQKWIPGEEGDYPDAVTGAMLRATSDFNPFVWNGRLADGCQARLTTSGKHCASDGSVVTAVWLVDAIV